ncbi:hypothetical protein D7U77_06805 [Stenotrophomonas maltophilia]|uniref:hypothetical protein n=1 Tax=Stenotrophomonas maltophilia TaxID=40324 RepID=UPI0015DF342F|nr:hypothetical protein [Stenotrophomonas maltophilia]MBA0272345.1 hypothetical protein [Stenotrophomonas maltophilia]
MKQPQPSDAKSSTPIPDSAIEAFRAAYATHGTQKGYAEAIRAGLAASAPLISHDAMLSLEQDAQAYLVRQLDIALNGEAAAAREPVLADLLSQCQEESSRRHGPVLRTMPVSTENHLKSVLKDMARSAQYASDFATTLLNLINTREVHCG